MSFLLRHSHRASLSLASGGPVRCAQHGDNNPFEFATTTKTLRWRYLVLCVPASSYTPVLKNANENPEIR